MSLGGAQGFNRQAKDEAARTETLSGAVSAELTGRGFFYFIVPLGRIECSSSDIMKNVR